MANRVVLNYNAIRSEVMKAPFMEAHIKSEADKRAAGLPSGYEVKMGDHGNRARAFIKATNWEAARDNKKNNTLLRAIGS
ncbi:hypothetical protein LQZ18_18310 [Lachnospiraceae bacterium ZAX-1]